ncbi:MAG: SRPBCC domain-containing protein [Dehalococcoidia bacterium]
MIEPLRFTLDLDCPPAHAFEVWTARTSLWWPTAHTMSRENGLDVVFEPRAGGRIFERTPGGLEHEWGEVTAWEPPHRLAYLWHIATDRAHGTDVEIRFAPLEEGRTRVDIEHAGWERLGDLGPAWRTENVGGWEGVLPYYVEATR